MVRPMDAAQLRAQAAHYFQAAKDLGETPEGERARSIGQDYLQRAVDREETGRFILKAWSG